VISGQWSVVSGQWSVVSGQWSVVSGQLKVSNPAVLWKTIRAAQFKGGESEYLLGILVEQVTLCARSSVGFRQRANSKIMIAATPTDH
jgi:hypothetical protein